jgi:hypothetical protein
MNTTLSLSEEISKVKASSASLSEKRNALIKLGLRPCDLWLVLGETEGTSGSTRKRTAYTFGVEIECVNCNRNALLDAASFTGFRYEYQGYNHNDSNKVFKFVTDGSLVGRDSIECVSPVLKGTNGKRALKVACDTLAQVGATVNRSCGLHVHVGAKHLTNAEYSNVFANYYYLEGVIDAFMAPSRRNNFYARSLQSLNVSNFTSRESVKSAMHNNRYYKINPISYLRHGTIEFRQHQGSTSYEKISKWIEFCVKLVDWSRENRLTDYVRTIDEIPFLNAAEKRYFKARKEQFNH